MAWLMYNTIKAIKMAIKHTLKACRTKNKMMKKIIRFVRFFFVL